MKYIHITIAYVIAPFIGLYVAGREFIRVCIIIPAAVINEYAKEEEEKPTK